MLFLFDIISYFCSVNGMRALTRDSTFEKALCPSGSARHILHMTHLIVKSEPGCTGQPIKHFRRPVKRVGKQYKIRMFFFCKGAVMHVIWIWLIYFH